MYLCAIHLTFFPPLSVPDKVVPTYFPGNDTQVTVVWNISSGVSGSVVRYIINVRQYFPDGDGKVSVASIAGYPLEVPGTVLQHVITSLGKFHRLLQCTCIVSFLTEPLVPYHVQLVAGNVAGCGEPVTSQPFFTREGGVCS